MREAASPEKGVQEIRRKTRRRFSAEEKIRIVLEGLRGEESIATLCRKEGLHQVCTTAGARSFSKRARGSWSPTRRVLKEVRAERTSRKRQRPTPLYLASGSGRIWNLTRFPGSTGPPSTCHAASAPYVA